MPDPTPLPLQRPPKQTLHHVWAPKLARPVVLNGRRLLRTWVLLEANPEVSRYCERPSESPVTGESRGADFWAVYRNQPTWLVMSDSSAPGNAGRPSETSIVRVSEAELEQHRIWIENWLSLLPYLSFAAALDLSNLRQQVLAYISRETRLEDIERHFGAADPMLVRAAVVEGLHRGELVSADIQLAPWTASVVVSKAS